MWGFMTEKKIKELKKELKEIKKNQYAILYNLYGDEDKVGLSEMINEIYEKLIMDQWLEGYQQGKKDGYKLGKEKTKARSQ